MFFCSFIGTFIFDVKKFILHMILWKGVFHRSLRHDPRIPYLRDNKHHFENKHAFGSVLLLKL